MLLYDRVIERMARYCKRHQLTDAGEIDIQERLLGAVVYEISSIVPLFDDWDRERNKPISKRSPHEVTWCEWEKRDGPIGEQAIWKIGCLISEFTTNEFIKRARANALAFGNTTWKAMEDKFRNADHIYAVDSFKMMCDLEGRIRKEYHRKFPMYDPACAFPNNLFAFKDDGKYVGHFAVYPGGGNIEEYSLFGLDVLVWQNKVDNDPFNTYGYFWPPFMAFSLLHCKNVCAEKHELTQQQRRRVERSGNPPRCSWRTIVIRVPETLAARNGIGSETDQKMRFHLCRGHFKNLKHPRFKNPGLHWWPAHWRGDPELGEVSTDRRMESK